MSLASSGRCLRTALITAPLLAGAVRTVLAQSAATDDTPKPHYGEAWTGAEAFRHAWSLNTGATWAPFGPLDQDGFRVRAVAGVGRYSYRGLRPNAGLPPGGESIFLGAGSSAPRAAGGPPDETRKINGQTYFAEALAGYQWRFGELTLKAFAGAVFVKNVTVPFDPDADWAGMRTGVKAAVEAWYNITPKLWSATDLGYVTLDKHFSARQRLGWRLLDQVSVGVDAGLRGSFETPSGIDHIRAGALLRYDWPGGEVSVTGGWAFERERHGLGYRWTSGDPFATVTVLMKF